MTKLNPCPECGNEPDILSGDRGADIFCNHCDSRVVVTCGSIAVAINAWNAATSEQPTKTLRDEFAMAALTGLLANSGGPVQASNTCGWGLTNCSVDEVSSFVFSLADDMIRERGK